MKQRLKVERPRRLLVWDPLHEYAKFGQVANTLGEMLDGIKTTDGKARARFARILQPKAGGSARMFGLFCKLAHAIGGCTVVVEELALVTQASRAPEGWRELSLTGRHRGVVIMAGSQRPASIDKDFFSNCTRIRCGRLNYQADVKTMGDVLGVKGNELRDLAPLEWIERDMGNGSIKRGKIVPMDL